MTTGAGAATEPVAAPRQPIAAAELEAFYRELFLPLVRRAIFKHGLSEEDARDIVQEAFVVALVKMKAEGNADAWFCQVVDFLATNLRRKVSRRAELLARWSPGPEGAPVPPCAALEEEL